MTTIHKLSEFDPITSSKGGLFDVGPNHLEKHVGKLVRFKEPPAPYYEGLFIIVCIQRIYTMELAFRVEKVGLNNDPGKPAPVDKVEFIIQEN